MSGYPIRGEVATITSVTASTDLAQLLTTALRETQLSFNESSGEFDVSALDGTSVGMEYIPGLGEATLDFTGRWPRAAPRMGNKGLVSGFAYVEFPIAWTLEVDFGEEEITAMAATAPTYKSFMPKGRYNWRGTYTCLQTSGTAPALVQTAGATAASITLMLSEEGTNDHKFTGSAFVIGNRRTITPDGRQAIEFSFRGTGTLTEVLGDGGVVTRILTETGAAGAGTAVSQSEWDTTANGVADVEMVLTLASGRTLTSKGFRKSVQITCKVDEPIDVSGTVRLTDTITAA